MKVGAGVKLVMLVGAIVGVLARSSISYEEDCGCGCDCGCDCDSMAWNSLARVSFIKDSMMDEGV